MNRLAPPCAALALAASLASPRASAQPLVRAPSEFATEGARVELAGLAGTTTLLQGLPVPTRSAALALGTRTEAYAEDGWLTAHRIQMGRIGWGSEGLEGDFFSAVEGGPRWTTRPGEGPFVRGGVAGAFVGSRQLLFGWVTAPRVQLGFQRLGPHHLLEGGLHAGALVFGRFDAEPGERALGPAPAFGPYLAVHIHRLRLDVEATRIEHADGPATVVRGTLCGHVGAFALCADGLHAAVGLDAAAGGAALPVELFRAGLLVGSTSIIP